MPQMCFSYLGNVTSGTRGGTNTTRFSYSAGAPAVQRTRGTNSTCFGYPADVPALGSSGGAVSAGPRGKTNSTCFRY